MARVALVLIVVLCPVNGLRERDRGLNRWSQLATDPSPADVPQTFAWDGKLLAAVRARVLKGDADLKPAVAALVRSADSIMKLDTSKWTVMAKNYTPPSGDKHDYMSVAIYYWPCNSPHFPPPYPAGCNTSTGLPWVSHDGVVDTAAVEKFDSEPLGHMAAAVMSLVTAWYFSDNQTYASKAHDLAEQWFLAEATRMNPNLNFGQGHPGGASGGSGGIIDTVRLVHLIDALQILKLSKSFSEQTELQSWFSQYSEWLTDSHLGKGESRAKNNHGTWYDAQLQNYALYAGKPSVAKTVAMQAASHRIDTQILPDGEMPLEEQRTKAWSYTNYNLQAFFNLATSALHSSVDLFTYTSSDGRSIRKAVEFLLPYMLGEKKWPHKQIVPFKFSELFEVFRRAAIVYENATFESVIQKASNVSLAESVVNLIFPRSAVPDIEDAHHPMMTGRLDSSGLLGKVRGEAAVPSGYTRLPSGVILPDMFLMEHLS